MNHFVTKRISSEFAKRFPLLTTLSVRMSSQSNLVAFIGFARVWLSPFIEKWVMDGFAVTPEWRGQGIGTQLLVESINLAAEMGARELYSHLH